MNEENITPKDYKKIKNVGINLYDKVLELRKFEIENFWKRTLFFWGTIAIVLAGYFSSKIEDKYLIFISLIGVMYNIIFALSVRGSKYWQEHWETIAVIYEDKLGFNLFKTETSAHIDLKHKSIMTYPYRISVSKLTMLLSDLTVIMWLFLWIKDFIVSCHKGYLRFEFGFDSKFHMFTVYVILLHTVMIGYFILFLKKGKVIYRHLKNGTNLTE